MLETYETKIVFFIVLFDSAAKRNKRLTLATFREYFPDMESATRFARNKQANVVADNDNLSIEVYCHINMSNCC